ncbi:MAG TPA: hypothetical protein VNZ25_06970 [Candidatus Angelobacter sp.]|nr:hypothetical protein [Candidatus Angelobacter sp.]
MYILLIYIYWKVKPGPPTLAGSPTTGGQCLPAQQAPWGVDNFLIALKRSLD